MGNYASEGVNRPEMAGDRTAAFLNWERKSKLRRFAFLLVLWIIFDQLFGYISHGIIGWPRHSWSQSTFTGRRWPYGSLFFQSSVGNGKSVTSKRLALSCRRDRKSKLMSLNDLTCRTYLLIRELKLSGMLRRIPGVNRLARRLRRVLLPGKPVWVLVRSGMSQGMWMRLNLRREPRLRRGEHEPILQAALRAAVFPGTVVYDIGAHAGSIARLVGPNGRVVAFEADPQNVENLRENRDRNRLTETLRIVSSAVWSCSSSGVS